MIGVCSTASVLNPAHQLKSLVCDVFFSFKTFVKQNRTEFFYNVSFEGYMTFQIPAV